MTGCVARTRLVGSASSTASWTTCVPRTGWALEHGDAEVALQLCAGLRYYALYRFRDEVVSWGEAAIALPGATDHRAFAVAAGAVGEGLTARGELRHADGSPTDSGARRRILMTVTGYPDSGSPAWWPST